MTTWEAYGGVMAVNAGKRRNGKPKAVLMVQLLVCMTEADAKLMTKHHPQLKFVKKTRRAAEMKGHGS